MGVGLGPDGQVNYGTWNQGSNVTLPNVQPNPASQSYYWNPHSFAPGTDGGYAPLGHLMLEQNPDTAFYRYGQQIGIPDPSTQSAFGRWFAQQFGNFKQGYDAYTVSNPFNSNIQDYANSLGGYSDWLHRFNQLAPQLRGLDAANRGGGPARWVGR